MEQGEERSGFTPINMCGINESMSPNVRINETNNPKTFVIWIPRHIVQHLPQWYLLVRWHSINIHPILYMLPSMKQHVHGSSNSAFHFKKYMCCMEQGGPGWVWVLVRVQVLVRRMC